MGMVHFHGMDFKMTEELKEAIEWATGMAEKKYSSAATEDWLCAANLYKTLATAASECQSLKELLDFEREERIISVRCSECRLEDYKQCAG